MTARISDNPNHRHYGPVRRLWVMLTQLDLLDAADQACDGHWEVSLAKLLDNEIEEKFAQRTILYLTLHWLEGVS